MSENKKLNYNRDDVYIISLNKSSDLIEETKILCYNDPQNVYQYFARVEACYDKSWSYMTKSDDINKKLKKFKKKLYDKKLLKDLKDQSRGSATERFLNDILSDITELYREMTASYIKTGLFPKFYLETDEVGAVREGRNN
jgi:hypothetical protein